MSAPLLSVSRRLRRTAFSQGVEREGVKAYTVYNRMLLPTVFKDVAEDARHLKSAVQVWDVAAERQVEIRGPDARRLVQWITPRDLSKAEVGQCLYIPVCDDAGGMLNDPVLLKLSNDRYWVSLADSDLLLWIKGLAIALAMKVEVFEPDVSPLAVQGPKADELMARVFGDVVRDIRFFRFAMLPVQGKKMVVARSGWSKQGGFEIYVDGAEHGMALWDQLFAAGADLDVRAGCPNGIERIEAGLLSFGNDMDNTNTPYECGLGKYCHPERVECIGREALMARATPERMIRPVEILGAPLAGGVLPWQISVGGAFAGIVTSAAYAPERKLNVAIAMVERAFMAPGTALEIAAPDGPRRAVIHEKFWY